MCQQPCVDAPKASTNDADFADAASVQSIQLRTHVLANAMARTQVGALLPAMDVVAALAQERAQHGGGAIAGRQPWQYQHRMAVSAR